MQEATIVERLLSRSDIFDCASTGVGFYTESDAMLDLATVSLIKRQKQVIDLLLNALDAFADIDGDGDEDFASSTGAVLTFGRTTYYSLTLGDLRRAREAKVEAEKILNSTPSTAL